MRKVIYLTAGMIILTAVLMFLSYAGWITPENTDQVALISSQIPDGYAQLLTLQHAGLVLERDVRKSLLHLQSGYESYIQIEDVRILPRLSAGFDGSFTPHYISTIVFVSLAGSTDTISAFSDLEDSDVRLYVPDTHKTRILPAMALAMKPDGDINAAADLLSTLQQEGRLITGMLSDESIKWLDGRTVALMPDDEAARLILSGQPLRMVVPADGTLSFTVGLYAPSDNVPPINLASGDLAAAGFRALDGSADPGIYPPDLQYGTAKPALAVDTYARMAYDSVKVFRRKVMRTHLFSTADGRERVTVNLALAAVLVFWGVSLFWRVVDHNVRKMLQVQIALLLLWLAILILKQSADSGLTRYLWYLYYLPLTGSSLILPLVSLEIAGIPDKRMKRQRLVLIVPSSLFIVLVMTNDWHQWVFSFPAGLPRYDPYMHAPGFFLMAAWITGLLFSGLYRLYHCAGSRRNGRYITLLSLLLMAVMGYNALYIAGVQIIRQTQTGTFHIIAILLLWELTLSGGLIPYNRHYRILFQFSRLPLFLLQSNGNIYQSSTGSGTLPDNVRTGILMCQTHMAAFQDQPDLAKADYEAANISGGYTVWKNDLAYLRQLNENLHTIRKRLVSQTMLLAMQVEQERTNQELSARRHLLEQLDQLIRPRLNRVSELSANLSQQAGRGELKAVLTDIVRIVGYCKRAGLIHISAQPDGRLQAELLVMMLQEACSDQSVTGFAAALYGELSGTIELAMAMQFLDFFTSLFDVLKDCDTGTLFVHAGMADGHQEIIFLCDLPADWLMLVKAYARKCQPSLADHGIRLTVVPEHPSLRLILRCEEVDHA